MLVIIPERSLSGHWLTLIYGQKSNLDLFIIWSQCYKDDYYYYYYKDSNITNSIKIQYLVPSYQEAEDATQIKLNIKESCSIVESCIFNKLYLLQIKSKYTTTFFQIWY